MRRSKQIDVLRAVAVFLVLGRHMPPCPIDAGRPLHVIATTWARGGWIGVDLFFVLSGFLVSHLLFRERATFDRIDVGRFLIRRGLKIYPAFWLLLAITVAVALLSGNFDGAFGSRLLSEVFFVQNYRQPLWNHTWSLAVEEHFYVLLVLLFATLSTSRWPRGSGAFVLVFSILAVGCLGLRIANASRHPYTHETHLFPSHLRFDSLFFGVLLASLYDRFPERLAGFAKRNRWRLCAAAVPLLTVPFVFDLETTPFVYVYGLTLAYVGSGLLLLAALGSPLPDSRWIDAIAYGGSHSYSIYLWHMPVATWLLPPVGRLLAGHESWPATLSVYLLASVAFGLVAANLVEFPVLRLRDHLFPSRARLRPAGTPGRQAAAGRASLLAPRAG
jgi:peptidoglycan/LPS O-acetylase OafA/YrhL